MTFESFEDILSLLCTIGGLLYCAFKYIETPKRGYRYIIGVFLAFFLSEYYWTTYELVMHSYPDVSEFTAYLGWNVGFFFLLLAVLALRREGARRYFHPVMLLPIAVNVPQFLLYIRYGGLLNNLWMVGVTTITMAFCLQDLAYCLKRRVPKEDFPLFSLLALVHLIAEYGMWTSSCFDWGGELLGPYLYCSVLSSAVTVFLPYGAVRRYRSAASGAESKGATELRFRVLLQTMISLVIIGICIAGVFVAFRIKSALSDDGGFFRNEGQLVVCLFAISAVLILLVLVLLHVLASHYRSIVDRDRNMSLGKRSQVNLIATIAVTLALMVFAVAYNNANLYNVSVVSVYEDGEKEIKALATELESYLTVAVTTLRVAADSVDLMGAGGSSIQEIQQFIVDQTTRQSEKFDENFTGIYAYYDGEYLDGLNWEPPEGYEPTERDWYKTAAAAGGEIVIVSPYVDAQTGSVVITIGKSISDGEAPLPNVVCLDVIVNHIQELTQAAEIAGKGYGLVVNSDGFIVAHRSPELNGRDLGEVYGPELLESILGAESGRISARIDGEECILFIAPVMEQWYSVLIVGSTELFEDTYSQLTANILVSLATFCLIAFFYYVGYKNEQIYGRKVEEMNLQVVSALATAIDAKDTYTNGHSGRVANYSREIAKRAGFSEKRQSDIYMMGLLHDVGKIGVPDAVINKPASLSDDEWDLVKNHPVMGARILKNIKEMPELTIGARWHHEKYDGSGYPDGLSGNDIPEEARIIAIADAYDAMTSRRSYRDPLSQGVVREELEKGRGKQFDPVFADIMLDMINEDTAYEMRES